MITYSTQFPINHILDIDTFYEMVIKWIQGSKHNQFDNLEWDRTEYQCFWQENNKQLIINLFEKIGVVASRFSNEDNHGLWKTDFVMNYEKAYLTIRVTLETTEFTTDFSPSYFPPFFVKKVIYGGYAGSDGGFIVQQSSIQVNDNNCNLLREKVERKSDFGLPLVVVTRTEYDQVPIELSDLAFRLQGVAHVLEEGRVNLLSDLPFGEFERKTGQIYIVFPNQNMKTKVMNLSGEKLENQDIVITRIINEVYGYTNQILRMDIDTWEGVENANLHHQNSELISGQKAIEEENSELYEVFEEQLKKMESNNDKLNRQIQRLTVENQALRMKLASLDKVPVIYMGEERDFYTGEIREIILEILSEYRKNYISDTRRDHLIKDLLENNDYEQLPSKKRETIKKILKGYRTLNGPLRNELEAMGFEISDDGKHYKWTYYGDHRYVETVSKTCSDGRAGLNIALSIDNLML